MAAREEDERARAVRREAVAKVFMVRLLWFVVIEEMDGVVRWLK